MKSKRLLIFILFLVLNVSIINAQDETNLSSNLSETINNNSDDLDFNWSIAIFIIVVLFICALIIIWGDNKQEVIVRSI